MDIREAVFKDCEFMRQESWQSMKNRNSILTFGLATIGVIFLGAINAYTKSFDANASRNVLLFSYIVISFGIPILSNLLLILWLGEAQRMNRLGVYIATREELINSYFSRDINQSFYLEQGTIEKEETQSTVIPEHYKKVVYWENYIRQDTPGILKGGGLLSKTRQLIFPYVAVVILFIGFSFASTISGITLILDDISAESFYRQYEYIYLIPIVLTILTAVYTIRVYQGMNLEWSDAKKQIESAKAIKFMPVGVK